MPIFASDLRTRTPLRVFALPRGGSVAVCHPLSLRPAMFVTGSAAAGFTATFEGCSQAFDRYGDAVEAIHCAITEIQRHGRAGRQYVA
jgi:hypothetical protein